MVRLEGEEDDSLMTDPPLRVSTVALRDEIGSALIARSDEMLVTFDSRMSREG